MKKDKEDLNRFQFWWCLVECNFLINATRNLIRLFLTSSSNKDVKLRVKNVGIFKVCDCGIVTAIYENYAFYQNIAVFLNVESDTSSSPPILQNVFFFTKKAIFKICKYWSIF